MKRTKNDRWGGTLTIVAIIAITAFIISGCVSLIDMRDMEHLSEKLAESGLEEKIENKVVLVVFWARMSEPCKQLLPEIHSLQEKYRDKGLVVIIINQDGIESASAVAATLKQLQVDLSTIHDDGKISDEFRVEGLPAAYLFNREHILVEQKEIDTSDIELLEAAIVKALKTRGE